MSGVASRGRTMARRYSTEIRGDGATRTWTLPHGLDDPKPTVSLRDAANRVVRGGVRSARPSASEVAITFPEPPPIGTIYQVEVVAEACAHRPDAPTASGR
jgi:hypothetical protein